MKNAVKEDNQLVWVYWWCTDMKEGKQTMTCNWMVGQQIKDKEKQKEANENGEWERYPWAQLSRWNDILQAFGF